MTAAVTSCRLAIVLSHPTQYYSPWFQWLRAHTAVSFRVFYLWDFGVKTTRDPQFQHAFAWDVDLLSGYDHEFVPNTAGVPGTHHFGGLRNPDLTRRLAAWNPDAVLLFGYKWNSHLRVIAWARRRGVPLLFRGDSHLLGRRRLPPLTRVILRTVYAQFRAFLAVGRANDAYFRHLGVPEARLFFAPHSVDAQRFTPDDQHARRAAALRQELGIAPSTRVILFAGKLVPAKQPAELLKAYLSLPETDSALVFVGEGPEKPALIQSAAGSRHVHFLPFANQSEIPSRYAMANVFALPSRGHYETWGLAVNEAMHMGVPCLVSDLVGCQQDLVVDGETGWVFAAKDAASLRTKLAAALAAVSDPTTQSVLRDRVRARISGYTYAGTTAGLLAALATLPPARARNSAACAAS